MNSTWLLPRTGPWFYMDRGTSLPTRKAFTLMELLVVLGIVSLLSALSFSVFARARESGRRATCQNNLKQIALAVQQYTQDNGGAFPSFTSGFKLFPLLQAQGVLRCPSAEPIPVTPSTSRPGVYFPDYVVNTHFNEIDTALVFHEVKIVRPSNSVMAGDGYLFREDDSFKGYGVGQAEDSGSIRHSGGANYAFCDGHVKWLRPAQISSRCPDRGANSFTFCLR